MKQSIQVLLFYVGICCFTACYAPQKVSFEKPVDTTTKAIEFQIKKTYTLEGMGVHASNEFDGARLNGFEKMNDSTALVIVNPENQPINKSAYYAFSTWSDTPKAVYFKFQYPEGHSHRYFPKLKKGEQWTQIDSSQVFREDDIVTIRLELDETPVTVAAQEIQSSTDVRNWYTKIIKGKEEVVKLASAGKSIQGRNLPVLDMSKGDAKGKDIVVLMTRQHPPEVTGYTAFKYFIETILNDSELSNQFLEKYHVLVFPIINPDGVDLGHWRHNVGGVDTNRDWSVYAQKEVKQVARYITKSMKQNNARILLGMDFHSTYHDVFYTNKQRKDTTLPLFVDQWFEGLEANIPNYKVNEAAGNSTKPVSKGWFLYGHNAVGITYEIGDNTPKQAIETIGKVSAEEMMKILVADATQKY